MKNWTVRRYSLDSITASSERYSQLFKSLKKAHHYGDWVSVIRFLRKRGWTITENAYYKKQYTSISQYHKIGVKGDVRLLMEITGRGINIDFGHVKNLWKDMPTSFWSYRTDDRHNKLTYLEYLSVDLERIKTTDYFISKGMMYEDDDKALTPEERIIGKLGVNTHIHGVVTFLQDIKTNIESDPKGYNWIQNSNDKCNEKIRCGDRKYFWDWKTKRLFSGIVWHNINNMWWVIIGKELRNVPSFELFDYIPGLPKRFIKDTKSPLLKKLNKAIIDKDFLSAHKIQQVIYKLYPDKQKIR